MSLLFPLIAWGAAEDINSWTSFNTPVITTGQADPFGGTDGILIEDNVPASVEGKLTSLGVYNGTSMLIVAMAKAGTAGGSLYLIRDTTAGVSRGGFTFTWSGGVPTVTVFGSTTLFGTVALGGGWYLAFGQVTGLTSGNVHERRCYGATSSAGGTDLDVGSTYWYLRNVVLLDHPAGAVSWDEPREGTEFVEGLDGTADAWLFARMYRFRGEIIGVPSLPRGTPLLVSGWEGANEFIGVNCGVQAMLKAGQDARTLTFVPDRGDCLTSIASKLVKPSKGDRPTSRLNGDRSIGFEVRNTSLPYPLPI